MQNVAGLVLAAGGASRFGRPKQLVVWQDETLIRRVVQSAHDGGCASVAVVVGDEHTAIEEALRRTACELVPHPQWRLGLGSSIRRGVRHFLEKPEPPDALVLLACDQPFLDAGVVQALIARWQETRRETVASRYAGTLGVPALFDRARFDALLALPDESGAKPLLQDSSSVVAEVAFPEGAIDIDTPADLEHTLEPARPRAEGSAQRQLEER